MKRVFVFTLAAFSFFALRITVAAAEFEVPRVVNVPAGEFSAGSTLDEREFGYRLDELAYGHDATRKQGWYDRERRHGQVQLDGFEIMVNLVTNDQYQRFVSATGRVSPWISQADWKKQGLIHPYERVRKFLWNGRSIPSQRENHPVGLVTWEDATAFAEWMSRKTGDTWRLPSELEWEKAAGGPDGNVFPWGNEWKPELLNSHDSGPFDTLPVGRFPDGASPFGMLDAAGQVFEWTLTTASEGSHIVKGGSWDDKGCGVCRTAARHSRPDGLKHILVGFRLVRVPDETNRE